MAEDMRRLALRLTPDHWIFDVAPRERAAVVRQALDMAALVNRRFDRIEEMLRQGAATQVAPEAPGGFVSDILASIDDL